MRVFNLSEDLAIGLNSRKVVMFRRYKVDNHSWQRIFKIKPKDDIDPQTAKVYPKDHEREVLVPTRERAAGSRQAYPHHSKHECRRRKRQIAKGMLRVVS